MQASTHPITPRADSMYIDLSGVASHNTDNPYDAMIEACSNDAVMMLHKTIRSLRRNLIASTRYKFRPDM